MKHIKISDTTQIKDNMLGNQAPKLPGIPVRGRVRITNPDTNEIILEKDNMITYKGRILILSKLFDGAFDPSILNDRDDIQLVNPERYSEKQVLLFNVGTEGTPESEPFNPLVPDRMASGIESVPFITMTKEEYQEELAKTGPNSDGILNKYGNPVELEGGKIALMSKRVGNSKWFYELDDDVKEEIDTIKEQSGSEETNCESLEIYKYFKLKIEANELRGQNINQIGLQFALYDQDKEEGMTEADYKEIFTDIEQFSIFNFPSESLQGTKRLLFEYFIFA